MEETYYIRDIAFRANVRQANGTLYPQEVLEHAFEKLNRRLSQWAGFLMFDPGPDRDDLSLIANKIVGVMQHVEFIYGWPELTVHVETKYMAPFLQFANHPYTYRLSMIHSIVHSGDNGIVHECRVEDFTIVPVAYFMDDERIPHIEIYNSNRVKRSVAIGMNYHG